MNPARTLFALAAVLISAAALSAPDDADLAVRQAFRAALLAAEQDRPVSNLQAFARYPLYAYLQAAPLRRSLLKTGHERDADIAAFLDAHDDEPVSRPLRREWYASLGQRQQWKTLLALIPAGTGDAEWRCLRYAALTASAPDTPKLRDDLLQLWLTGETQPQACIAPFDWLAQQSALTPELKLQRARLALNAGNVDLADELIRALPDEQAAPLRRESRLLREPVKEIPALAARGDPVIAVDSVYAAWDRYIRAKPDDAVALLDPLLKSQDITPPKAGEFVRELALGLAWSRDARALDLFQRMPESARDEHSDEWRVRAALWNGQWALAAGWLAQMSAEMAAQPRWRYWRARLAEHEHSPQAPQLYRDVLDANNYYAAAAAVRLQQPALPRSQPAAPRDPVAQKRLNALPALVRARELLRIERDDWARAEWSYALADASDATRVQAAYLAAGWGWYVQAVGALAQARAYDDYTLTHPHPYDVAVLQAAEQSGLRPDWIYGVLRQESLYDPRAVSKRDARGLLQLLLPTARAVARRWNQRAPSADDLYAPDINLTLGSDELREQVERFNGSLPLALCAYNAGSNRPLSWLPPAPMDADIWIENIPFNETRTYVQKIIWNVVVFGWERTGKGQDVGELFRPIGAVP
ncbi:MAG TPA: transglycosylase SLT domain-containing protein [Nevskiaceae bacterium]|nr:transglycosylase SLT domain-containing protein [Nevskiaceae bacterium]